MGRERKREIARHGAINSERERERQRLGRDR